MKFSNAVMLELLSKEGRAELFEPFVLREILRGQWDVTYDLDEVNLSFEETEAEIAAAQAKSPSAPAAAAAAPEPAPAAMPTRPPLPL